MPRARSVSPGRNAQFPTRYGHAERIFTGRSIREFGVDVALAEIADQLNEAQPGDVEASVAAWFDHYERYGDLVVRNLADEADPAVAETVRTGRKRHRQRVVRQFAPQLTRVPEHAVTRLVDGLVCACDVYTWKLLRRDIGRSRERAEATMCQTVRALLGE